MAAKYGKKAQDKVEKAMHERKRGTLKSGSSGKKVKSRKQAIAIGLSEARREGGKVPSKKSSKKSQEVVVEEVARRSRRRRSELEEILEEATYSTARSCHHRVRSASDRNFVRRCLQTVGRVDSAR